MNDLSPGAVVSDERSIQVVVDRMLDGYSVTVLVTEGKLTRGLAGEPWLHSVKRKRLPASMLGKITSPGTWSR